MYKKETNIRPIAVIVLAAGLGKRMRSNLPKVLHTIAGRPMIQHLLASVDELNPDRVIVVVSEGARDVQEAVKPHLIATQSKQLGTGHAALQAAPHLSDFEGDILILFGGDPLIAPKTMLQVLERRRQKDNPAAVVLGFRPADPGLYGRLLMDDTGSLQKVVEAREATQSQLTITFCNSGVMAVDSTSFFKVLKLVKNDNKKEEYYLTDIIRLYRENKFQCVAIEATDPETLIGVDTRADLARVEAIAQDKLRSRAMAAGATLVAPETVFFSFDTALGRDVIIEPNVVFGRGVTVGDNVTIRSFCHLDGTSVSAGATIGPFARLRPGSKVSKNVNIGNFVEIKNSKIEPNVKVNHLSYVGDARVGANANVGAGTITCNYDGSSKHHTNIGEGAFIGSNTALVAPVSIGEGAVIGAGSVISKDVNAYALAVARAPQKHRKGWANKLRRAKAKKDKTSS